MSTFVGAFGGSLKETRLTALLGYLIALEPEPFLKIFGFKGKPRAVQLENQEATGRSDIRVETSLGVGIVEAKVGASDPLKQCQKYPCKWRALLTQQYRPINSSKGQRDVKYVHWAHLGNLLKTLSHSKNARVRFISQDLTAYLEENHMIKQRESVEIYAREINEPVSLTVFLKAHMYGCWYEEGSRLSEALYFAPHFAYTISNIHAGVHLGISYIAKVEQVEVVETWQDFQTAVITLRGKKWWLKHLNELKPLKTDWDWSTGRKRVFLFLAQPRLVFNPPVQKEKLQKGTGFLSKRFHSFDELFSAWGCQ